MTPVPALGELHAAQRRDGAARDWRVRVETVPSSTSSIAQWSPTHSSVGGVRLTG